MHLFSSNWIWQAVVERTIFDLPADPGLEIGILLILELDQSVGLVQKVGDVL